MLILPIALEKNEVRRMPWVSFALIGLCFLVHLAISTVGGGAERAASDRSDEMLRFLGQHPYLSPSPPLLDLLGNDGRKALDEIKERFETRGGDLPPDLLAQEQQQLNRLTDEAFQALQRLPSGRLGFVPAHPNPFALVTYTFVHGGWLHLVGNMLFLFLTAPFIEDLYGRPLFTALYFVAGVAGAGAFAAGAARSAIPLVGASGAIAGVMAAFLVRLAARRIEFLVLPIPILWTFRFRLKLPAFVVIPLWAAEQIYYTSVADADSSVAYAAHVGGFAAGLVFAGAVKLLGIEERFINPAIEREIGVEQDADITNAADARVARDFTTARRLIEGVLRKDPANVDAWTQSFEIALDAGDAERAGEAGLKLLELYGRGPDRDMVWTVVNDPRWREFRMPSRFLSTVAGLLAREGDARGAIELYRRQSDEAAPGDVAGLRALVSEGELLARAGDARAARAVLDRARAHPACTEPWQERIERVLRPGPPARAARP
jgi:membrane associated rhomboid family serine protease